MMVGKSAQLPATSSELLRIASGVIEDQILNDSFPDAYELHKRRLDGLRSGTSLMDSESTSKWPFMAKQSFSKLPDSIIAQYEHLQCRSFLGLLPEINRVWITIDNRLFLWNYEDLSKNDINTFEDQDQIIVNVALVKPIKGVFLDQVEYILVVSTPLEIIMLAVAFNGPSKDGCRGEMTLIKTDMTISSDNINMTQIAGTDDGRIFMRGNNGFLYELVYQAHEGWFTRKVCKINRSLTAPMDQLASFLWGSSGSIKFFTIDNARKVLYTVTKGNEIELFYLGGGSDGFKSYSKMSDVLAQALRVTYNLPQTPLDERNFQIISMHPVSPSESNMLNLVAVTATGHRLFFSHARDRFSQSTSEPSYLRLLFVRPPPVLTPTDQNRTGLQTYRLHMACYAAGLTVGAQSISEELDRIFGISVDCGTISKSDSKFIAENVSFADIDGRGWSICEAHTPFWNAFQKGTEPCGFFLNELVTQLEYGPRQIYLLTNTGLTTICKERPIDILIGLISSPTLDSQRIAEFQASFGNTQCCAMSLAIACGHSNLFNGATVSMQRSVMQTAASWYFDIGGYPTLNEAASKRPVNAPFGVAHSTETKFSAKHNGLALYVARILRPVWKKELVKKTGTTSGKTILEPSLDLNLLVIVQQNLDSLDKFLKKYPKFTALPTPDTRPSNIDPVAWKTEQQSFASIHELIIQSIESIAFISMIIDFSLPTLAAKLRPQDEAELKGLTFETFVSTKRGREIAKSLMTCLLNSQIEKDVGIDSLIGTLQLKCPTICEDNDSILFRGLELIQSARLTNNRIQQEQLLKQAYDTFITGLKHMSFDKLPAIVDSFKGLGYFNGIVELCLAYAANLNVAEDLNIGGMASAPHQQSFQNRIECYKLIVDTLIGLDTMITNGMNATNRSAIDEAYMYREAMLHKCLESSDQLFHNFLYDWFIAEGKSEELLEIQTPFLEQYLLTSSEEDAGIIQEKKNLLWRFYARIGKYAESASLLSAIAHEDIEMDLETRIEYLTQAVTHARSSGELGATQQILSESSDALDVALIQFEILKTVQSNPIATEGDIYTLRASLLDLQTLYYGYVRKFGLHEIALSVLHTSDQGAPGRQTAEQAILAIINQTLEESARTKRSPFDAIGDKIKTLAARFYSNENVFPLKFVIGKLEQMAFEKLIQQREYGGGQSIPTDWLVKSLREAKISHLQIFTAYHEIFEAKLPPWSSVNSLSFLIRAIGKLLEGWLREQPSSIHHRAASGIFHSSLPVRGGAASDFPARFVDECISKYLVTIPAMDNRELVDELRAIQSVVRSIF